MATMNSVSAPGLVPKKLDPAATEGVLPELLKSRTQTPLGPVTSSVAPPIQPYQPPAPSEPPQIQPHRRDPNDQMQAGYDRNVEAGGGSAPSRPARPAPPPAFNPLGTSAYMQQFTPENTIRATRITGGGGPTADTRAVDQARDRASGGLPDMDRAQIAKDILSQLISETNPDYENELRQVNKMAAAGGRLGAGITTTRLGDVTSNRQQFITDAARKLSSEAAGLKLDDELAKSRFSLDQLESLRGLEGQRFGQGVTSRDELRGERQYENTMANDARQQEIERILLEEGLLDSSFGRDQQRLELLGRYGFGGNDPSGTLMQGAGNLSNQAGGSDLLSALLYDQARRRPA